MRADAALSQAWADCCRRIDAEEWVPSLRPHLDQIALPIAAARCGLEFTVLDESLNYPAHLQPLRPTPPVLCRYHVAEVVAREPALASEVASLVEEPRRWRPRAWRREGTPSPPRRLALTSRLLAAAGLPVNATRREPRASPPRLDRLSPVGRSGRACGSYRCSVAADFWSRPVLRPPMNHFRVGTNVDSPGREESP